MGTETTGWNVDAERFSPKLCLPALLSMIAGILGMFFCLVGSIPAIALGHSALKSMRDSEGKLFGAPLAWAGLVLGYGQLVLFVLFFGLILLAVLVAPDPPAAADGLDQPEATQADHADASAADPVQKVASDLESILGALEKYRTDCGSWPSDGVGVKGLTEKPEGLESWRGPYLDQAPLDPWGNPYFYRNAEFGVEVFSTGPDGEISDDDVK